MEFEQEHITNNNDIFNFEIRLIAQEKSSNYNVGTWIEECRRQHQLDILQTVTGSKDWRA